MPRARSLATSLPFEDGNERNRTGPRLERESERAISIEELPLQVLMRAERQVVHSIPRACVHLFLFLFFSFFFLACASLFACDHVDLVRNAKKLKWASAGCMAIPVISYYSQVQLISIWNQNWICIFPRKKKN